MTRAKRIVGGVVLACVLGVVPGTADKAEAYFGCPGTWMPMYGYCCPGWLISAAQSKNPIVSRTAIIAMMAVCAKTAQ